MLTTGEVALFKSIVAAFSPKPPAKKRAKSKADMTLNSLFKETWKDHWSLHRYQQSGWGIEAKRNYENYIRPHLGTKRISTITAKQVREWHARMEDQPYKANRCLEVLSKMFRHAEVKEWRPQGSNPCAIVKAFRERKRSRFASEEEIKKIGQILVRESEAYPEAMAFLYVLMFSGSRPSAIERARWDELQIIEHGHESYGILKSLGKTSHKTGEDEIVILPPQAMSLITKLPRKSEQIFNIKMPRRRWRKIQKEAGCGSLWVRDFRRTFATIGLSNGIDIGVIGELLNHKSTQTTKIYAQLLQQVRIEATSHIAKKLEAMLGDTG